MADGGEAAGAVIVGAIAVAAAVMVIWTALAATLEIFSYLVLVYYPLAALIGLLTGMACAATVIAQDLLAASTRTGRTLTPDDVAGAGTLFSDPPRGPARYFGWDRAWPRYLPFQAQRDIVDATRAATRFLTTQSARVQAECRSPARIVLYIVFGALPHAAFALSFVVFAAFLVAVCATFVLIGWLLQVLAIVLLRTTDAVIRRVFRLSTRCVTCYEVARLPSYRCVNCSNVHRDLRPSRLGVLWHRCECSAVLPTTIIRASSGALRKNIVCPYCDRTLPDGSGSRQTIQVPTFGAVGVGKTRLLFSAAIGLHEAYAPHSTRIGPLDGRSRAALDIARDVIGARKHTTKTAHGPSPVALAILVEPMRGRPVELHLLDAAGEHFTEKDGAAPLHYLHSAETLLFVIDPFSTDDMRAAIPDPAAAGLVVGDSGPEDSYSITVELLRSAGLDSTGRALGIVVSKVDDLRRLGFDPALDPDDQQAIEQWLVDRGLDNLVTRAGQDFGRVRYFLADSMGQSILDPCHPLHIVNWLAQQVSVDLLPAATVGARP
ncbi:TRAFAC clade GTPase domain-containing protein [Nocardia jiangsuensis]|uniref:Double-GTPase 2 domain-containing protein n=1 Tax=Nocardia jiangsuensis TaxID=1691563 RepID=A0ABV8E1X4_9NOCA